MSPAEAKENIAQFARVYVFVNLNGIKIQVQPGLTVLQNRSRYYCIVAIFSVNL